LRDFLALDRNVFRGSTGAAQEAQTDLLGEMFRLPKKRISKSSAPNARSQRRADIMQEIKLYLDSLAKLYRSTDPLHGPSSEEDKLEAARQAISIWWYLWADLMLWAQSHLAGYETLKSHPQLRERLEKLLGTEITVDSHALEYVGVYLVESRR
jgi:hypothetical protein